MNDQSQWLASWKKLYGRFEDAALEHPQVRLCLRRYIPGGPESDDFVSSLRLSDLWQYSRADSSVVKTEIPRMLTMGICSVWSFGLLEDQWCVACLVHKRVSEATQDKQSYDDSVRAECRRAKSCNDCFEVLASDCSRLIGGIPEDVPLKLATELGTPLDYRTWIDILFAFSGQFPTTSYQANPWLIELSPEITLWRDHVEEADYRQVSDTLANFSVLNIDPFRASIEVIDYLCRSIKITDSKIEMLKVNKDLNQVRYDGVCYDVKSDGALLFDELVCAYPDPISASKLFSKPSRVKNELPEILKEMVKSEPAKGYRLVLPE
jgi:hypothetical protein